MDKLSCARCRKKKLKCDKQQPCSRCIAAGAFCATVERKARPTHYTRTNKQAVNHLSTRIETLERVIQRSLQTPPAQSSSSNGTRSPVPPSGTAYQPADSPHHTVRVVLRTESTPSSGEPGEDLADSFNRIRMTVTNSINALSPETTAGRKALLSNAVDELDAAIANFSGHTDMQQSESPSNVLSEEETLQALEVALNILNSDFFVALLDRDFVIALRHIMSSPHVQIDPAVRVVYYCLVFHGYVLSQYKTPTSARTLYLRCLQSVPDWHAAAQGSMMDIVAASLLSWTCVVSSESRLSWEFHQISCQHVKLHGLDRIDALYPPGIREADTKGKERQAYWRLVFVDLMYRLCYDKPSSLSAEASLKLVKYPSFPDLSQGHPDAIETSMNILWGRMTFVLKDFFDEYDKLDGDDSARRSAEFQRTAEHCIIAIENLMKDWKVLDLMRANRDDISGCWSYADFIICAYHVMSQMERLCSDSATISMSDRSIRISRALLDTIIEFYELKIDGKYEGMYMYSVAFYPFHAIFTIYYNILSRPDAEGFNIDIRRLEKLQVIIAEASERRFEYQPIAKAITSLNQITQCILQIRLSDSYGQLSTRPHNPQTIQSLQPSLPDSETQVVTQWNTTQVFLQEPPAEDFLQLLPEYEGTHFLSTEDFRHAVSNENFEPLSYMEEVEAQFVGRDASYAAW